MKILILIGTLFIFSCGKSLNRLQKLEGAGVGIDLSSPNSCVCTMIYEPVCGVDNITYDNSCLANCKGVSYSKGLCKGQKLACNPKSGLVCGQPPMPKCPKGMLCKMVMPSPKTYANTCTMNSSGARLINIGQCN